MAWTRERVRRVVRSWSQYVVPAVLLAGAAALKASQRPVMEDLQNRVFDGFQRRLPRVWEDASVRIVDIDDETLRRFGQWPWPRTLVARLVDRLRERGAAAIAFDIVFAEPDRTSPREAVKTWSSSAEAGRLTPLLARLPDHDAVLARAIARAPVVTGTALTPDPTEARPLVKAGYGFGGDDPLGWLWTFSGAVVNLPELEKGAAGNGNFAFLPERDGLVRRVHLFFRVVGLEKPVPLLGLEAVRVAIGSRGYKVLASGSSRVLSFGEHTGLSEVVLQAVRGGERVSFVIPTDGQGRIWLHDTGPVKERVVPAWCVLAPEGARVPECRLEGLEGGIVFIGTSAPGLKDIRSTPLDPAAPGVVAHAQLAEQVLLRHFLRRPDWAVGAEVVFLLGFGALLILLLPRFGAAWCAGLAAFAVGAAFWTSWVAYKGSLRLVDPVGPSLAILVVYLSSSLISYLRTEAERRHVRDAFSRYMHPSLVAELARHPERLTLGGETRNMTILFSDIRGFTTISEQFDAHGLTRFINRFLTPMTEIVMERRGYIDKYIGDCIMAFWNAPLDDAEHAANACRAALGMSARLVELDRAWAVEAQAEGRRHVPIHVGIGINSGDCCVGNLGADMRFNYSVLGDDVNLASRLEGQSKTYGVEIVIGQNTREKVSEFAVLELDLIQVKGKTRPVRIFTVLGDKAVAEGEKFRALGERHGAMLEAYRAQEWDRARRELDACRGLWGGLGGLYDLYAARIEAFIEHPPGRDWDGVYTAKTK